MTCVEKAGKFGLKRSLSLPIIYVTHSLEEVACLADSVVLIEAGSVTACGPLSEVAGRSDLLLGCGVDAGAVVECRVEAHDEQRLLTPAAGCRGWVLGCRSCRRLLAPAAASVSRRGR